nr:acyl-CoA thioesterase domain-containing protein [Saccharopolyspora sp. HNM0983]
MPAGHADSPWAPNMMHGRLFGGLLARELETEHGDEQFHFARLTVDLFRSARLDPVRTTSTRVRDGRRIRVADAEVRAGDSVVARASAVLLRRGAHPAGTVVETQPWDAPRPEDLPGPRERTQGWIPPFDTWMLDAHNEPCADLGAGTARRAWLRDRHPLLAGEPVSPFVRAALAADFASPLANYGADGLEYINADYTLTLSRLPISEEIGLESTGHVSDDGVAAAECTMHDTAGPIGFCTVTAVSNASSH